MKGYLDINREAWNNRVDTHVNSQLYELDEFFQGKSSLPSLDLDLLGDIRGKRVLHLQCHFGMDTISLARLGAKVVGIDFSDKAIEKAKELRDSMQVDADFICCDIYQLQDYVNDQFDIVYTSYGVISWLDSLDRWAEVISSFLKPKGKFVLIEFHPILWMFDDKFKQLKYPYSQKEPYVMEESTYTENGGEIVNKTVSWNYGLSEPVNSLIKNDIHIKEINEYFYSPINLFNTMIETKKNEFQIKSLENKIPITYSIIGRKIS